MALDVTLPLDYQNYTVSFTAGNGTQCKILVDKNPPVVMAAITGETALPGAASPRQRIYTGGAGVIDGSIASSDGTARSVLVYEGVETSVFANLGAPTITGQNVLNRTAGSFITDGYKIGDQVMGFGHATAANDGVGVVVTAVAAITLTVNGVPFTNETMPSTYRLFRTVQKTRIGIPLNSGNTDSAPSLPLFGGGQSQDKSVDTSGASPGAVGALIVGMQAAVSVLPAEVNVQAKAARY